MTYFQSGYSAEKRQELFLFSSVNAEWAAYWPLQLEESSVVAEQGCPNFFSQIDEVNMHEGQPFCLTFLII